MSINQLIFGHFLKIIVLKNHQAKKKYKTFAIQNTVLMSKNYTGKKRVF